VLDALGVSSSSRGSIHCSLNLDDLVRSVSNLPVLDQEYLWIFNYTSSADVRQHIRPSMSRTCERDDGESEKW